MQYFTTGLTPVQLEVLRNVGKVVSKRAFYLAGGTGLAIYFGHRQSVDLDWFTESVLPDPLRFAQTLREEGIPIETENFEEGTLHGSVNRVLLSFLEYHYTLLQPCNFWSEGNCYLASLDDIASMKLAAVAQRGSRKDFIDVYALVQQHRPLASLLDLYQQKYKTENIAPVLMGLAYFDDADEDVNPAMWQVDWHDVKKAISAWVRAI